MANAPTGGTPGPDNEDDNELQHKRQNEEEPRRPLTQHGGFSALTPGIDGTQLPQLGWSQPRPASPPDKSETLAFNWQDILAQQLSKLNQTQRSQYDQQIYGAKERNAEFVSPNYQLELSAFLAKDFKRFVGYDLHRINEREDRRAAKELNKALAPEQHQPQQAHAPAKGPTKSDATAPATDRQADTPRPTTPRETPSPAIKHDSQRQNGPPTPREAAPDRTTLARKRLDHLLAEHAQRRKELNLPLSRAAQNEFAALHSQQEAERKALLNLQSEQIQLLDYQHVAERVGIGGRWLARDLKQRGSPEAAGYEKESKEALRAAGLAYEERQSLVSNRADRHGWARAASSSTVAPPSQTQEGPTRSSSAATPSFQPTVAPPPPARDPTAFFKDSSGAVMTVDRLRAMLGRYEELRQSLGMASGPNETNEQSRLATAQATVRKDLLSRQENLTELLAQKHLGERAGTSSHWMEHDTHQLRDRTDARRAFAVAWHAMQRFHAIEPRAAAQDRTRTINRDQDYSRQSAAQEAAKGGRTLSAEERANLPTEAARASRDRGKGTGERFQEARPGHQKPGRGNQNSRGGGGRGR